MRAPAQVVSRIAELDGLRGIAIALVLWHHLVAPYLVPGRDVWSGWLLGATNLSWCGVDLFFVLSGFFIGGILLDQRGSARLARVFYLRRAVRILPLYYLTLSATFTAIAIGLPDATARYQAWTYATFLTNFLQAGSLTWEWLPLAILWSLAVEEQFYLAAPWVARWLPAGHVPRFLLGLVGTALLFRTVAILLAPGRPLLVHVLMPMRMDALALGTLAAWLVRHEDGHLWLGWLRGHWRSGLVLGLLPAAALTLCWPIEGGLLMAAGGYTLLAGGFACLLLVTVVVRPPALVRVLALRPLVLLGRYSFFLYLWHGLLAVTLIRFWGGPDFLLNSPTALLIVTGACALTLLVAWFSWRCFEEPLIRWGRKYSY